MGSSKSHITYTPRSLLTRLIDQQELSEPPSDAISALKFAPNSSSRLLVSSWDRHVYLYDEHEGQPNQLVRKFEHRAPVLDVCFGKDDDEAFSVGLDWDVRRYVNFPEVLALRDCKVLTISQDRSHNWRAVHSLHPRSRRQVRRVQLRT